MNLTKLESLHKLAATTYDQSVKKLKINALNKDETKNKFISSLKKTKRPISYYSRVDTISDFNFIYK